MRTLGFLPVIQQGNHISQVYVWDLILSEKYILKSIISNINKPWKNHHLTEHRLLLDYPVISYKTYEFDSITVF